MELIDTVIRTLKGIIPDSTWDFIFAQFTLHTMEFKKPFKAVRVSKDYILVRVPKQETPPPQ